MTQSATEQHSSPPDVEDDYSKYEVVSRSEILSILRGIQEQRSEVSFYFNQGDDFLLTSLIATSADGKTLVFAYGSNKEANERALDAAKVNCVSSLNKVKIQFALHGVDPFLHDGRDAFLGNVPETLVRLQRREYYRTLLPKANPPQCRIPVPQRDGSLEVLNADLVDISVGGLGLTVPPNEAGFSVGTEFSTVRFDLPKAGTISAAIRIVNGYDVSTSDGKTQQRVGCEFIKLPSPMLVIIQRYIVQVEQERKSREL